MIDMILLFIDMSWCSAEYIIAIEIAAATLQQNITHLKYIETITKFAQEE